MKDAFSKIYGRYKSPWGKAFVVSEGTVKTHVKSVLAKLGLRDRTQAASFAYETGFVQPRQPQTPEEAPIPIAQRRFGG